jgi:hypothetical protein
MTPLTIPIFGLQICVHFAETSKIWVYFGVSQLSPYHVQFSISWYTQSYHIVTLHMLLQNLYHIIIHTCMFYHLYSVLTLKESVFFPLFSKWNNEFKLQNMQVLMVLNFSQVADIHNMLCSQINQWDRLVEVWYKTIKFWDWCYHAWFAA